SPAGPEYGASEVDGSPIGTRFGGGQSESRTKAPPARCIFFSGVFGPARDPSELPERQPFSVERDRARCELGQRLRASELLRRVGWCPRRAYAAFLRRSAAPTVEHPKRSRAATRRPCSAGRCGGVRRTRPVPHC